MNDTQSISVKEWVTDVDEKYLSESQAFYLKNREFFINIHGGKINGKDIGPNTPIPANYKACEIDYPAGENYTIGTYSCDRTNEVYVFVFNSNGVNFIYRINVEGCEIVYDGDCLPFSSDPKNAITQWRVWLDVRKTCKNWGGKRLIWADGNFIGCLDVEASIATGSFTTDFFKDCSDPCDFVKLCVQTPFGCLKAEYLPPTETDKKSNNKMVDVGFQFMYRWVYYDGRKSTWSDISSYYFQSSKECFENEDGFSHCMKIRIPVGNAKVAYIELAYTSDNGASWFLAERIEKYKQYNNSQQQWYERQYAEIITSPDANFSTVDCAFDYKFCNDKQCEALDPVETNRVYNPFPRGAQCLIPYKESIAFINYIGGNCPLPKSVVDNTKITLDCDGQTACIKEYVTVTVRAVVHDFYHDRNQFIYVLDDNKDTSTAWFGGLNDKFEGGFEIGWNQHFNGKKRGFTAYIDGTENFAEMKQYKVSKYGEYSDIGIVTGMDSKSVRNDQRRFLRGGGYYVSVATFKVVKGTKGFIRLQSHIPDNNDPNTSTHVKGITSLANYRGDKDLGGIDTTQIETEKEIYFNTCNGDQHIFDRAFVIRDNAVDTGAENKASAISGYVKDSSGNPLEGLSVGIGGTGTGILGIQTLRNITDHNGYYSILIFPGQNAANGEVTVFGEKDCGIARKLIKTDSVYIAVGEMAENNILIDDSNYINNNYAKVIVNVRNCDDQPVSGIRVSLSGTKSKVSNNSGQAIFKIRNYFYRARALRAVLIDKNGCLNRNCELDCTGCLPELNGIAPVCFVGIPQTNLGLFTINVNSFEDSGAHLKPGGRYGFGILAKGDCGNLSFVNKGLYIDIPKKCNGQNSDCSLKYDFSGVVFDPWVRSVSIVRTKNLNPFELQWIVDKVEYVDNKIKFTIQSLNDYNFNNFFQTNTVYQYLKGDRIEIIADENGKYFCDSLNYQVLSPFHDKAISGQSDAPALYFNQLLIEDDGRIGKVLQPGTIIEMQRPKQCNTDDIYYTICADLDVVDGVIVNPIGKFHTFDTYRINRTIGTHPAREFDHHSPSDFWGDKITDIGTPHIVNQFEDEKRLDRNITISAADDFNRFGETVKTIGNASMGGIVAAYIWDGKLLMFICENDNFIAQTADDLLRVSSNGTVQAVSGDQAISDPQPKLLGQFGCQYEHVGSIYFGDGYATWADVNKHAYIMHNYQIAKDVSFNKIGTWTGRRFQEIQTWNNAQLDSLNKYRFSTGYNHHTKNVMLTLKQLRQPGIDNALVPWVSPNETIIFRPDNEKFYGQPSYTPEAYASLNLFNNKGAAFLTFINADAWVHPIIPMEWGKFYDVPVDQVVGICFNKYPEKKKIGLALEIQDPLMWFLYKATTDEPAFETEIPPIKFKNEGKDRNKWNASFLHNKNGPGGLSGNAQNYAGEGTRGYFIKCIFVRDNTDGLKYNTIDNSKRLKFDNLDMIICKFAINEQSGFTENL